MSADGSRHESVRASLFRHLPGSVRDRLQPLPSSPDREAWDELMAWEDEMLAFANAAAARADRLEAALRRIEKRTVTGTWREIEAAYRRIATEALDG